MAQAKRGLASAPGSIGSDETDYTEPTALDARAVMEPKIDLSQSARRAVAGILNAVLADEYLLYTKSRNYHWNVTGPQFHDLHKFFEAQYEELDDAVDDVAERVRALGGVPVASLGEFLKLARLPESPAGGLTAKEMLARLLADHEALIRTLRRDADLCAEAHHDAGTNDFLVGLMEQHEKMAWMLRASLESTP